MPNLIDAYLKNHEFEVSLTEHRGHGKEIAAAEHQNFDAIVAIGGDGTVNEIGSELKGTKCAMGVIPAGSGNGLARHLKIPLNVKSAIERIDSFSPKAYDTGMVNNLFFASTAGFGFDGHIAELFDKYPKRGFLSYAKLIAREYKKYEPLDYVIEVNGEEIKCKSLLCAIANSSQFGNGFTISPDSDMQDGKFELVMIEKFPFIETMAVGTRFFTQTIKNSKHFKAIQFEKSLKIQVGSENPIYFHVDGEPLEGGSKFQIEIKPKSLLII